MVNCKEFQRPSRAEIYQSIHHGSTYHGMHFKIENPSILAPSTRTSHGHSAFRSRQRPRDLCRFDPYLRRLPIGEAFHQDRPCIPPSAIRLMRLVGPGLRRHFQILPDIANEHLGLACEGGTPLIQPIDDNPAGGMLVEIGLVLLEAGDDQAQGVLGVVVARLEEVLGVCRCAGTDVGQDRGFVGRDDDGVAAVEILGG